MQIQSDEDLEAISDMKLYGESSDYFFVGLVSIRHFSQPFSKVHFRLLSRLYGGGQSSPYIRSLKPRWATIFRTGMLL